MDTEDGIQQTKIKEGIQGQKRMPGAHGQRVQGCLKNRAGVYLTIGSLKIKKKKSVAFADFCGTNPTLKLIFKNQTAKFLTMCHLAQCANCGE